MIESVSSGGPAYQPPQQQARLASSGALPDVASPFEIAQQIQEVNQGLVSISEKASDQQSIAREVDTVLNRICV